jgi:hypothetical protein
MNSWIYQYRQLTSCCCFQSKDNKDNVVLFKKKNNKKLPWPNTFYTSLYLYKLYIEIIKEGQARSQEVYKNKQITEKKWNLVIWYFWLSFFLSNSQKQTQNMFSYNNVILATK